MGRKRSDECGHAAVFERELCKEGRDVCVKSKGCVLAAEHVGVYMGLRGLVV